MRSLSETDKNYLKLLILDCKTFHLNETESIAYISNKLNRKIARSLYYNCKKEMSDNDPLTHIFSDSKWKKSLSFIHEIAIRKGILNSVRRHQNQVA